MRLDGTIPTNSLCHQESPFCRICRDAPNSTRLKTCGSSFVITGSRTVPSNSMTRSSTTAASPGTTSSASHGASWRSECDNGDMCRERCAWVLAPLDIRGRYIGARRSNAHFDLQRVSIAEVRSTSLQHKSEVLMVLCKSGEFVQTRLHCGQARIMMLKSRSR